MRVFHLFSSIFSHYDWSIFNELHSFLEVNIYERMNKNTDTTIIQPQVVNFLYTNGKSWVYVQAEDGTGGWFKAGDLSYEEKNQLFSGLLYAD